MKLNGKYRLRKVGDTYVVVSLGGGEAINFSKLITLNETGAFIFEQLAKEATMDQLVDAITGEYDISPEDARSAAETYIAKLRELGIAEV